MVAVIGIEVGAFCSLTQREVDVARPTDTIGTGFGHERRRQSRLPGDVVYCQLENGVAISHVESLAIREVDLPLAEAPLALAHLHVESRRVQAVAEPTEEWLPRVDLLHGVVGVDQCGRRQFPVSLATQVVVGLSIEVELQLGADIGYVSVRPERGELLSKDCSRRNHHG